MENEFKINQKVRVIALPAYVKTAEPMPMLRPPNVIKLGEVGTVLDRRPGGYWAVRFDKGAFLMESQYLESVDQAEPNQPLSHTGK
ncbi:MAG: regulatory protein SipA [Microcoleaceae cyanobacterium]